MIQSPVNSAAVTCAATQWPVARVGQVAREFPKTGVAPYDRSAYPTTPPEVTHAADR
jgi:hypothetical protein